MLTAREFKNKAMGGSHKALGCDNNYARWFCKVALYDSKVALYNSKVALYNSKVALYNSKVALYG